MTVKITDFPPGVFVLRDPIPGEEELWSWLYPPTTTKDWNKKMEIPCSVAAQETLHMLRCCSLENLSKHKKFYRNVILQSVPNLNAIEMIEFYGLQ